MRNSTDHQIELTLIRHGATEGNLEKRYIGRTDEVLCEEGKKAILAGNYPPAELVFASSMKRCLETAELIYPGAKIRVIEKLKEMDFGAFEGKNYHELNGDPDYQAWIDSGATIAFPGGESRAEFVARVMEGAGEMLQSIEEYLTESGRQSVRVSCVAHGGTVMAILSVLAGGDYFDYQVGGGEGYLLRITCADGEYSYEACKL